MGRTSGGGGGGGARRKAAVASGRPKSKREQWLDGLPEGEDREAFGRMWDRLNGGASAPVSRGSGRVSVPTGHWGPAVRYR